MFKPAVVFLAFSNDERAFLPALKAESEAIYSELLPVEEEQQSIVVRREESAGSNDIDFYLGRYKNRLAIFHYAGHAEGRVLSFENQEGHAEGLARLLGLQARLKLVFLNACSTQEQASLYIKSGVKAVIATSLPVVDAHAQLFSTTFYRAMAQSHTLESAYLMAIGTLQMTFPQYKNYRSEIVLLQPDSGETVTLANRAAAQGIAPIVKTETVNEVHYVTRKLVKRGGQPEPQEIPWRLYIHADFRDVLQWKMTTPPILSYLQEGSRRYFERLHQVRFHYIDFDSPVYTRVEGATVETSLLERLQTIWEKGQKHAFLTGKGGTGKTTNTVKLWKQLSDECDNWAAPVPIYISLSDYNQGHYERNFILYSIAEHYLGLKRVPDTLFNQLYQTLREATLTINGQSKPAFVLLLDGLDEIVVPHRQLLEEIGELANESQGCQVVITNDEILDHWWSKPFGHIELMPPPMDLSAVKLPVDLLANNSISLEELLENPLLRQLYLESEAFIQAHIDNTEFEYKMPVTTRGELMWNALEVDIARRHKWFVLEEQKPFKYFLYRFLAKHFLPNIAYEMEQRGVISVSEDQLQVMIHEVCNRIYQRHFLRTFKEYRRDFAYLQLDAPDWVKEEERFEIYAEWLTEHFEVFIRAGEQFQFTHQLYRDFLAAMHIRNDIQLSLAQQKLPITLKSQPLNPKSSVLEMLGEVEGEHYQGEDMSLLDDPESLLSKTLAACRGQYDPKAVGYTVWNVLNIWRVLRQQLAGLDLSGLDLRGFSLNGIRLQAQGHHDTQAVHLQQTLLDSDVFLKEGQQTKITAIRTKPFIAYQTQPLGDTHSQLKVIFAMTDEAGSLKLWDHQARCCFDVFEEVKEGSLHSLCFTAAGQHVIGAGDDGKLRVWNLNEEGLVMERDGHYAPIKCMSLSQDGQWLATGSEDTFIHIWQRRADNDWVLYQRLAGHLSTVESVDFSPCGRYLASGSWDRSVRLWEWRTGATQWIKQDHVSVVRRVLFSPDGQAVLSASSDDTLLETRTQDGRILQQYFGHNRGVNDVQYAPSGDFIVSASSDRTLKKWDRQTGKCTDTLRGHQHYVTALAFGIDDNTLYAGDASGALFIWNVNAASILERLTNFSGLHVQGIDFRQLHQDSHLTSQDRALLRQYGALFDDEDERKWEQLTGQLCQVFETDKYQSSHAQQATPPPSLQQSPPQ